jgi:hypothetical protein
LRLPCWGKIIDVPTTWPAVALGRHEHEATIPSRRLAGLPRRRERPLRAFDDLRQRAAIVRAGSPSRGERPPSESLLEIRRRDLADEEAGQWSSRAGLVRAGGVPRAACVGDQRPTSSGIPLAVTERFGTMTA